MPKNKKRTNYHSSSPLEPLRGYCRAVKVGDALYISGTTAMNENGDVIGGQDPYEQTKSVIQKIRHIVETAGFRMSDIVRTRLFVTDVKAWSEYARAHREVFDGIRPASSILEVRKLVDTRLLVEMEAEAILGAGRDGAEVEKL